MKISKVYERIKGKAHEVSLHLISLIFGVDDKKILFSSFGGRSYSDNPRAICEAFHILYPEYKLYWMLEKSNDKYRIIPDYIRCIPKRGFMTSFTIATAKCYVYNENLEKNTYKDRRQFFVQTWHGDRGFKRILHDAWENDSRPSPVMDGVYTDLAISGSVYGTNTYHSAFHYKGLIAENGSPRNDKLINPNSEEIRFIKSKWNINEEVRILLYAPTFRDVDMDRQTIEIDLVRTLNTLEETTKCKWISMVRTHPIINGFVMKQDSDKEKRILDVSDYPDMTDILCITDFLITDYSSSILDYYLTGRPSVCIVFDEEYYEKSCRKFKVRPEESGAIIARTQNELEDIIKNYKENDYRMAYKKIDRVYGTHESGNASVIAARLIYDAIQKK